MSMTLTRRGLLAAAAVGIAGRAGAQGVPGAVPWSAGIEAPRLVAPPGAVDCHHHIYGSSYPINAAAALRPPDATVADYRLLQRRLGLHRHVVVQPSTYGTNNQGVLDALAAFGEEARGIAVCDTSVTDAELARMDRAGIRGLRFIASLPGGVPTDMMEPLSARVSELGWHVQIVMGGDEIAARRDLLARLRSPVVFDHMGHIPQPQGVDHPAFAVIRTMLDRGRTWVKLSGAYIDSKVGPPGYDDVAPLARALVAAAPERILWGSDWPHPTMPADNKPDDAILLDLLQVWVPDERLRHAILVGNPAACYGFAA